MPLTLLLTALVLGGMGLLNGGGVPGLVAGVVGGLVFGLVICGIYLVILMANLTPTRYTRKLEQSVRELSMDETEREQLGKEMLAALEGGAGVLSYQMVGPNSKGTPARVILTPHYILQGSTPYAVLIRLSDIAEIRMGSERKIATTHGGSSKTHHYFTLYSIGFYRKDRFERGLDGNDLPDSAMGFFQEELRDDVVKMMRDGGLRVAPRNKQGGPYGKDEVSRRGAGGGDQAAPPGKAPDGRLFERHPAGGSHPGRPPPETDTL